jgi:hypothetical protein
MLFLWSTIKAALTLGIFSVAYILLSKRVLRSWLTNALQNARNMLRELLK